MPSNLTRHVLLNIIYNRPILHRTGLSKGIYPSTLQRNDKSIIRQTRCRTLFGFSSKPKRRTKAEDLDPGLKKMLELNESIKGRTRPPPTTELIDSFNVFFNAKQRSESLILEIQAHHAAQTFRHLQKTDTHDEGVGLSLSDMQTALKALTRVPPEGSATHNTLARALFSEITLRSDKSSAEALALLEDLSAYVTILTQTGQTMEARGLVEEFWNRDRLKTANRLWIHVVKGFAKENNESELSKTIEIMENLGVPFDCKVHQAITCHYARKDDVAATKEWYSHPIAEGQSPTFHTCYAVLKFCIRNKELEWGSTLFRSILEGSPNKSTWDIIFIWAASNGKGVDEIDRMMEVMARRNEGGSAIRPDIATINGLVEFANARNDPYMAERYIALGQKWKVIPNAQTYMLQMDYRLSVGDVDGARAAYSQLQGEEVTNDEDLHLVNRLVQALCLGKHIDYDLIMSIVEDLNERKARLEPETVSALCKIHLRRDELDEVIELLKLHSFHYSLEQRAKIRDVFAEFCLDRKNSIARAWNAYMIFRQVFEETSVEVRTMMMHEFFRRKRSDMACHVFGHMRQHIRQEYRPRVETYVACFEGIAGAADREGLDMVHNMLKLDSSIEPNTSLYTSLMLAYAACEIPERSLKFWEDITNSREGPTYKSIQIAFRACEVAPFGHRQAQSIWNRLKDMNIEITKGVFVSYLGALAGQGLLEEVKELIHGMEKNHSLEPDALTFGTVYNVTPSQVKKGQFEQWAQENYPHAWTELESLGRMKEQEGSRLFKIAREFAV